MCVCVKMRGTLKSYASDFFSCNNDFFLYEHTSRMHLLVQQQRSERIAMARYVSCNSSRYHARLAAIIIRRLRARLRAVITITEGNNRWGKTGDSVR